MLLRNKKTGEVVELKLVQVNDKCLEDHEVDTLNGKKLTLKSLADSFADVKEPLIKDGKIRKAVRAWAAANDVANVPFFDEKLAAFGFKIYGYQDYISESGSEEFKR